MKNISAEIIGNAKKLKTILIIGLIWISLIVIFGFKNTNPPIVTQDVKTFVSNDAKIIEIYIKTWSKYGYKFQSLIPQSVATSESYDGSKWQNYHSTTIKGDLILIMYK